MGSFGDLLDCCPGGLRGPMLWGHVSIILVPSSGFVPSLVPCGGQGQPGLVLPAPPALVFMGSGEMPGEKGLGQARRAPWHHTMLSPWSSPSGWEHFSLFSTWFGMELSILGLGKCQF